MGAAAPVDDDWESDCEGDGGDDDNDDDNDDDDKFNYSLCVLVSNVGRHFYGGSKVLHQLCLYKIICFFRAEEFSVSKNKFIPNSIF